MSSEQPKGRKLEVNDCPICWETPEFRGGSAILHCGSCEKGFHFDCILKLPTGNSCPCCRGVFNERWPQYDNQGYREEQQAHQKTLDHLENALELQHATRCKLRSKAAALSEAQDKLRVAQWEKEFLQERVNALEKQHGLTPGFGLPPQATSTSSFPGPFDKPASVNPFATVSQPSFPGPFDTPASGNPFIQNASNNPFANLSQPASGSHQSPFGTIPCAQSALAPTAQQVTTTLGSAAPIADDDI